MVEPLIPRLEPSRDQGNDLLAKAAPEATLAIAANPTSLTLLADIIVVLGIMIFPQVGLKWVPAIEDPGALVDLACRARLMAAPSLKLVMLGVFMAFPIVFATERFFTSSVSAAIGTGVPFFMLSGFD